MPVDNPFIPPEPLKDYASVVAAIQKLPAPKPGLVRVFRGQNGDHGKMLASGSRGYALLNSSLFNIATRVVAQNLFKEPIDIQLELGMMMFWTQAIAQHYGPGSSYLDVTYSIDIALWFALNEYHPVGVQLVYGPGAEFDPKTDILRNETWVSHRPWPNTAWLFVFDVPKWKPGASIAHGDLIDLAEAPPVFSSSARMKAQSGCLLAAGLDATKADLVDCYLVAPIPLARPMTGAPGLDLPTEAIFPGPEIDDWYRRFLSIPLVPQPDKSTPPQITMAHPLPITTYLPRKQELASHVMQCENGFRPPLIYAAIGNPTLEVYDPAAKSTAKYALDDATVLVVESPLQFITPPAGYDGWNQGILMDDISDNVPTVVAGAKTGSASTRNVFVEFSPLETPSITGADISGQKGEMVRAAWLGRNGNGMTLTLFVQSLPDLQLAGVTLHDIAFDASSGSIRYKNTENAGTANAKVTWEEMTNKPAFAKPLFIILLILRELSPILKAAPFPSIVTDAGTDNQTMVVNIAKQVAQLLRVVDPRTSRSVHFLRGLDLNESFVGKRPQAGFVYKGLNIPYAKLDPAQIRDVIAKNTAAYDEAHPAKKTMDDYMTG